MADSTSDHGGSTAYVTLLAMVAALGGLLFGYDTAVISGAFGFLKDYFFELNPEASKDWTVAATSGWAAASALIGCAVGAAVAGILSDWLGRKKVLVLSAILFLVSALGTAFPWDFTSFVGFRIIGGLGVGAASMTSPMYIAEVSPARIRGRMVSVNQFAIVTGMLIVYFVNYFIGAHGSALDRTARQDYMQKHGITASNALLKDLVIEHGAEADREAVVEYLGRHSTAMPGPQFEAFYTAYEKMAAGVDAGMAKGGHASWNVAYGWRWMFGSEAVPALLLLLLVVWVPESPRWLAKRGRHEKARAVLSRVGGTGHADAELAEIEAAIAHESGSIFQLLEPGMRIVLVIGVVLAILQQVTGINVFLYFAPEIFKKMGSGLDAALLQTVVVGAVNLVFTVLAIWTVDQVGRKPLMLIGYTGMGISLVALSAAAFYEQKNMWVLAPMLGYIACFALSVGPITWVILSEIFPTRIRGRAMAIATVCLWLANYVITQTFTMMDENAALQAKFHGALPFWIYAGFCVLSVVFIAACIPETKGKTLEEIERSWTR